MYRGKAVNNTGWHYGDKYTDQVFRDGESCVDVTLIRDEFHEDHEVHPSSVQIEVAGQWFKDNELHDFVEKNLTNAK